MERETDDSKRGKLTTITLNPHQEEAIRAGQVASVEELIDRAIAGLRGQPKASTPAPGRTVAEQGLGLFGSPEDAVLLDEVVSLAYAERSRPSRREQAL